MPVGFAIDPASIHQVNVVVAGISAGFTGTIFGHPLDLIKVRLQARSEYKGTFDCISKTMKNDGLRGMFRGISSPLFGLTVLNAITFGSYNKFNKIQESVLTKYGLSPQLEFYNHFVSGAGVGVICSIFSCPFEVIKVRMQLDGKAACAARHKVNVGSPTTASPSDPLSGRKYTGFF
jgi:solute carrier family 25 carnitine/acylcarnitine transporter 20/29